MKFIRNNWDLGLIFITFLLFNLIISPLNLDEVWNYGFTTNIFNGSIPYKDFNMVITPFYPFIMSLLMHIFGNNMLFFHIENSIIITILFYILKQIIGKNIYYIIPLLIWPVNTSMPNYNLFALFLVITIIYLEDKKKDKLIGLLLSLLILTKQSIGLSLCLTLLFKRKDIRKVRLLYLLIPIILFIVYLLLSNSFSYFINLSLLGLFDFNNSNQTYFTIPFFLTILFIIINILFMKKDKNNIDYYYVLFFASITIPIFDYYHFILFFILFLIVFIKNNMKLEKYYYLGIIFIGIVLISNLINFSFDKTIYPNNISHFEYRYLNKDFIEITNSINKLINKYSNVIIVGGDSYYHRLIRNEKITYFDLLNKGNWGYRGVEQCLLKIKEIEKNTTFFINKYEDDNTQTMKEVIVYIKNKGKKVEDTKYYEIYQIKE